MVADVLDGVHCHSMLLGWFRVRLGQLKLRLLGGSQNLMCLSVCVVSCTSSSWATDYSMFILLFHFFTYLFVRAIASVAGTSPIPFFSITVHVAVKYIVMKNFIVHRSARSLSK